MKQLRGFKYRFYPTSAQRLELAQTFGCTRYVYNWALALRTNSYYQDNVSLSYTDTSNALTKLKKDPEKPWLKQVSAVPLQQGLRHLNTAFINFFAGRNKYPRFKKKNGKQSAHYAPNAFKWDGTSLTLAKMSQPLRIRWSRHFEGQPRSVTISKDPSNRYFVSFLVEEELEQWQATEGKIGVDLGVKDVMVTSTGFASGNPKHYQKYARRLKTLQRRLAKKKKGSNNRYKARLKVAKLHAKIADCRKDFLHKLTTHGLESADVASQRQALEGFDFATRRRTAPAVAPAHVRENQAIYTETLAVKNMMANHKLSKAIADCGWGEALRQFQYKCKWHDRILGAVNRWFPSSKRCNSCGHILDKLPLDVREWTCPSCGSRNLRDKNAALNILAVGQTVTACGDSSSGEIDLLSLATFR